MIGSLSPCQVPLDVRTNGRGNFYFVFPVISNGSGRVIGVFYNYFCDGGLFFGVGVPDYVSGATVYFRGSANERYLLPVSRISLTPRCLANLRTAFREQLLGASGFPLAYRVFFDRETQDDAYVTFKEGREPSICDGRRFACVRVRRLILEERPSLVDRGVATIANIGGATVDHSHPSQVVFRTMEDYRGKGVVHYVFCVLSVRVRGEPFKEVKVDSACVVNDRRQVMKYGRVVFTGFQLVRSFQHFRVIFPMVNPTYCRIPVVLQLRDRSYFKARFRAMRATRVETVVRPPLSNFQILGGEEICNVRHVPFPYLSRAPFLCPKAFKEVQLDRASVKYVPTRYQCAVVRAVGALVERRRKDPGIDHPFSLHLAVSPFCDQDECFKGNPSRGVPVCRVF